MHVIVRTSTYGYSELRPLVFNIMDSLGGENIRPGSRVLIKPNLLSPAKPNQALLTHPSVIRGGHRVCARKEGIPAGVRQPGHRPF